MRKTFPVSIPAGQSWPACAGGVGALTTRFSWIRIDNRGGADVLVAFNQVPINAPGEYWDYIPSGTKVVRNTGHKDGGVSDDLPHTLFMSNIGTAPVTCMVTIADAPINDSRSGSSTGAGATAATNTGGDATDAQATNAAGDSVVASRGFTFNGATWDRVRSASGDALPAAGLAASATMGYNGATWDRIRTVALGANPVLGLTALLSIAPAYAYDAVNAVYTALQTWGNVANPNGRTAAAAQPSSVPANAVGASGAAATITLPAAGAGLRNRLTYLGGYTSGATTGVLTVLDGATQIFAATIPASPGDKHIVLPPGGIQGSTNTAMTISVGAIAAQVQTVNAASIVC